MDISPYDSILIGQAYAKYKKAWDIPKYREDSAGERYAKTVIAELGMKKGSTVLDLGCGTGKASKIMCKKGLDVHGIDIADNSLNEEMKEMRSFKFTQQCLWKLDEVAPADYIYCANVMEHIPENLVHAALFQIDRNMTKSGFFSISTSVDSFGPEHLSQQMHLTVRDGRWWADQLMRYWLISWGQDPVDPLTVLIYVHRKVNP